MSVYVCMCVLFTMFFLSMVWEFKKVVIWYKCFFLKYFFRLHFTFPIDSFRFSLLENVLTQLCFLAFWIFHTLSSVFHFSYIIKPWIIPLSPCVKYVAFIILFSFFSVTYTRAWVACTHTFGIFLWYVCVCVCMWSVNLIFKTYLRNLLFFNVFLYWEL